MLPQKGVVVVMSDINTILELTKNAEFTFSVSKDLQIILAYQSTGTDQVILIKSNHLEYLFGTVKTTKSCIEQLRAKFTEFALFDELDLLIGVAGGLPQHSKPSEILPFR